MVRMDKDIERLIVRRLDGALSEDEEFQLNREFIRNPEARRLMDEYQRIDELAAAALDHALGDKRMPLTPESLPSQTAPRSRRNFHRGRWLVSGAVAAALLAIFVARVPFTPSSTNPTVADGTPQTAVPQVFPYTANGARSDGLMRKVSTGRPRILRDTGREVFGVIGDDGNIYWIEVDRTRTTRVHPAPRRGRETL